MKWISSLILSTIWLFATPQRSHASTEELERAIYGVIPFGGEPYVKLSTRMAYVDVLLAYWADFDSRIPRLSPAEDTWLREELNSEGDRLSRAVNTREYALFSLSRDVQNCLTALNLLGVAQKEAEQLQTEMFHWLGVVKCYSNISDMMADLERARLSDGSFNGSFRAAGSFLIMDTLLDKVIPSAMADTMGWTTSAN